MSKLADKNIFYKLFNFNVKKIKKWLQFKTSSAKTTKLTVNMTTGTAIKNLFGNST